MPPDRAGLGLANPTPNPSPHPHPNPTQVRLGECLVTEQAPDDARVGRAMADGVRRLADERGLAEPLKVTLSLSLAPILTLTLSLSLGLSLSLSLSLSLTLTRELPRGPLRMHGVRREELPPPGYPRRQSLPLPRSGLRSGFGLGSGSTSGSGSGLGLGSGSGGQGQGEGQVRVRVLGF